MYQNGDITTRGAHEVEYKHEYVTSVTSKGKYIGAPDGEDNWTKFKRPGGFYWKEGGSNTNVSITLGGAYGSVSVSVPLGKTTGSTGRYISAPTNVNCKLVVYRDVTVTRYAVYKRFIGTTKWQFVKYENDTTWSNLTLDVVTQ